MDKQIHNYITGKGFDYNFATLVTAHAKHETGNFKSLVFNSYNNLFGYGYSGSQYQSSKSRPTTKTGEPSSWAVYEKWENSVDEILAWWGRRKSEGLFANYSDLGEVDTYVHVMALKHYFTSSEAAYNSAMQRHVASIKDINFGKGSQGFSSGLVLIIFALIALVISNDPSQKSVIQNKVKGY